MDFCKKLKMQQRKLNHKTRVFESLLAFPFPPWPAGACGGVAALIGVPAVEPSPRR